jgi:hypothetical protein
MLVSLFVLTIQTNFFLSFESNLIKINVCIGNNINANNIDSEKYLKKNLIRDKRLYDTINANEINYAKCCIVLYIVTECV